MNELHDFGVSGNGNTDGFAVLHFSVRRLCRAAGWVIPGCRVGERAVWNRLCLVSPHHHFGMNRNTIVRLLLLVPLLVSLPLTHATLLTFDIDPPPASNSPILQTYGDRVTADVMPGGDGVTEYRYFEMNGWTPGVMVSYTSERAGEFPVYFTDAEWPGVCRLWSPSFGVGQAIGADAPDAMPAGFEYYVTFEPPVDSNRGVILNSFVLDDRRGFFDTINHQVEWRVARGSASGAVLASGTATVGNGDSVVVQTGLTGTEPDNEPVVLVIKRVSGISDDLAIDDIDFDEIGFTTISYNTGSLGVEADGLNAAGVVLNQVGAVRAGGDRATAYSGGSNTTIPFLEALNPPEDTPFTIEFWARPSASDNDDAPVFNRVSDGDRSGWVFFQRAAGIGWNFRMYDGVGSDVGWDLTGGTAPLDAWSHVVAVWTGTAARLYVNGALADATNEASRSGVYLASTSAVFSVGAYENGQSPYNGLVDEIAFYPTALSAAAITAHFQAAANVNPSAYSALVKADGALVYLQQNPPSIDLTVVDGQPTVTFTGRLGQSTTLAGWTDLLVPSPYQVPANGRPDALFFRVRR